MTDELKNLQTRIATIEQRNKRVELDKAWEGSATRKAAILVLTYAVVVSFLLIIKNDHPFINAVVPLLGFYLSTLVVGGLKKYWARNR